MCERITLFQCHHHAEICNNKLARCLAISKKKTKTCNHVNNTNLFSSLPQWNRQTVMIRSEKIGRRPTDSKAFIVILVDGNLFFSVVVPTFPQAATATHLLLLLLLALPIRTYVYMYYTQARRFTRIPCFLVNNSRRKGGASTMHPSWQWISLPLAFILVAARTPAEPGCFFVVSPSPTFVEIGRLC